MHECLNTGAYLATAVTFAIELALMQLVDNDICFNQINTLLSAIYVRCSSASMLDEFHHNVMTAELKQLCKLLHAWASIRPA